MTENDKLDLILSEMRDMKGDIHCIRDDVGEVREDVSNLKSDMSEVKQDVANLKEDVSNLKSDMSEVKEDVADLRNNVGEVKEDVANLKRGQEKAERKITDIRLILENEIRVNIKRVAEGHLDLSRNLHAAMKPNNEVEMLAIRVGMLESDMRDVKAKVF